MENKIDNFSSLSVEYGVSTPIYDIDKIQMNLFESMNGKKMILDDRETFDNVKFIGEMNLLIINLKNYFKNTQPIPEVVTK